jgi:hypothetical protein
MAHAWLESDGVIVTGGREAALCGFQEIANLTEGSST